MSTRFKEAITSRFAPVPPAAELGRALLSQTGRPTTTPGDLLFSTLGGFAVLVRASARRRLEDLARSASPKETGGLLGGSFVRDATGACTVVAAVVEATVANAGPTHVHWSGPALVRARDALAQRHPDLEPIGWWHTHPNMGAFFSGEDRREQATWPREEHVGIVVGGHGDVFGVFHGPESKSLAPAEAPEREPAPTWRSENRPRELPLAAKEGSVPHVAVSARPVFEVVSDARLDVQAVHQALRALDLAVLEFMSTPVEGRPSASALAIRARLSTRDAERALATLVSRLLSDGQPARRE